MSLENLYRRVILDHYRSPRNRGKLVPADIVAEGHNPACGDDLIIYLRLGDDRRVSEARFEGNGCAIAMASASMLTEAVIGRTRAEVREFVSKVKALTRGESEGEPLEGEVQSLAGVAKFPVRVKCATLAWTSVELALEEAEDS